jgi:hypothetical protein
MFVVTSLARFFGSSIRTSVGCHQQNARPSTRAHRYCKKCRQYSVEDEKHFLIECPAYQDIRSEFQEIYD